MKKVIGILMVLVMVFVTGIALASDGIAYNYTGSEAVDLVKDWAEHEGLDDWLIENTVNGWFYGIGAVAAEDFKQESGKDWSIEAFNELSKKTFEMTDIYTRCVGFVEGYAVYRTQAESDTKVLNWKNGEEFHKSDIIFIVYSVYDVNGNF